MRDSGRYLEVKTHISTHTAEKTAAKSPHPAGKAGRIRREGVGGDRLGYFESIYADTSVTRRAESVYMYLRDRMDCERRCWSGIKRIAADLKLSRSTVKQALNELEARDYLRWIRRKRENGGSTSNLYIVK